ncbi:MAG: hypothetical protein MK105_00730 [Crocinitomicaceae bacterium]|nr:hypothetical protein [Crocinitomicaceae bacterium]
MKILSIVLIIILSGCTLNADQEASLNDAMVSYVNSKNNGVVMSYVAFTHPNSVAYYKAKGDSVFKAKFDLSNSEYDPFLQDGNIREIQTKGNVIAVKYNFLNVSGGFLEEQVEEVAIFAMSEDGGETWFFIDEGDYFNDDIISRENRLITQ